MPSIEICDHDIGKRVFEIKGVQLESVKKNKKWVDKRKNVIIKVYECSQCEVLTVGSV